MHKSEATNLINGRWVSLKTQREIYNPADESLVGVIDYGGATEAQQACDAAAAAFESWSNMPARKRADILLDGANRLSERTECIGRLLALEAGKRLPEGVGEIAGSVEYIRWFAEQVRQPNGTIYSSESIGRRHLSIRRPAGVAVCLTPWNFPCSIQARKIAPALASGCTVVARVSEKAPLAATEMFRCLQDAGLPSGVLNLVHGPASEITKTYLSHPAVRIVSFTGSTEVGKKILKLSAERVIRPLMELGGNAPFLVFEDADIEQAVETALIAKFRNTGQSCIGANRFLVQNNVFEDFTWELAKRIDSMSVGNGTSDPTPDLGPCIDRDRVQAVTAIVNEAIENGARKVTRDFELPSFGAYCEPALLTSVPDDCQLATTEVFGPAAGIFPFATEEEAFERANATEMGLASYAVTNDQGRIWRLADALDAGVIGINDPLPVTPFTPMGGTKASGLGREGGRMGIEEFEEVRYIAQRFPSAGN